VHKITVVNQNSSMFIISHTVRHVLTLVMFNRARQLGAAVKAGLKAIHHITGGHTKPKGGRRELEYVRNLVQCATF